MFSSVNEHLKVLKEDKPYDLNMTEQLWRARSSENIYGTFSRMLATQKMVDGDTSLSLLRIDRSRLSAVSFSPAVTSQNRSVFAVHNTITLCDIHIKRVNSDTSTYLV